MPRIIFEIEASRINRINGLSFRGDNSQFVWRTASGRLMNQTLYAEATLRGVQLESPFAN